MSESHSLVKDVVDTVSAFTAATAFLGWLNPWFTLIAAIWTLMRIAEMWTGKTFFQLKADLLKKFRKDDDG